MEVLKASYERYRAVKDHFEGKSAGQPASGKWLAESGAKARDEACEERAGWEAPFLPASHVGEPEAPYAATPACVDTPLSWTNTLARSLKLRNVTGNLPSASCQQSSDSASDAAFCQLSAMLRQETRAWPVSIVAEAVAMGRVRAVAEARRARQVVRVALPLAAHDAHAVLSGHRPLTAVRESAPRDAAVRRGDWVLATAERHLRASTRLPLLARPAERVLAGSALIEPWVKRMRVPVSELAGELGLVVESEETNLMLLRRTREWASARIKEQSCMLLHAGAQRGAAALRDDWVRVFPLWHSDDASPPEAALPPGDEAGPRDRGGGGANSAPESFGGTAEDEPGQLCVDEEGHLVRLSPQELLRRIERGDSSLSAGLLMRQLVAAESLEDLTLLQGGPEGESRGGSRSQSTDGGALARIRAEAESRERGNGPLLRGVPALRVPAGGLPTTALPAAPAPRTVQRAWRFCAAVHVRSSLVRALRALSVADFALAEIAATGLALGSCIDAEVASVARAAGLATWPRPDPSLGSSGLRVATPKAADVEEAGSGAPRLLDPAGIECVGVGALHTLMTVVRALETAAARLADGEVEAARARMARGDTSLQSLGFAQPEEVSSDHMAAAVAVAAAAAAALEGRAWLLATLARASGACADASAFTAVVSWAADVGQLPTLNLHSVRALTDSALHAASLHYATTALDRVMRTAEREADAVFSNLPGTRALLLDAAAVQSCRDAAEAPAPAVGLAPRVGLRLGQMLRAVSARRMATALAHEGGAAAQQLPLLDSVQPSLVSLAGGGSQAQVTAVPGTLVATVAAQAGADPAGTAPAPEVFSRACRAALHYAQFAAACITAHEVEAAANGVLAARRGLQSEQHVASPSSRPEGDATIPRAASKQGEATPAVGLAPKLAALTSGEGRALALATRSLLRLADGVAAVGALLAGSGHSVPEVLDATRPLRLVVEKGVTDVKAAVEGIAVDAKGKRKDVRGGGDAAPSLGAVAAGLDASAAQWSGLQRQMVAVAAARRTVGDMGLHGLTLKGHDAPAGGDEPGRGIARRGAADVAPSAHSGSVDGSAQDGAGTGDILAQHVGVDGPIDTALILWDPTRPPAGVDSSCVLTETSVDVGRVELLRSIPRLAGVCTEHTGTSADQARLWAALSPLLHVSALVDAAKAQGGTDMAASTVETALTACATVHGALRGGYRFTEWMDMGAKIGRSLWHIAASQAFRTAVQLGSHAAVAVCVEAARMAVGRHGGDITHASTLLFSRAPSACKRTFLGTLSGVKSMLVTFLSADVSRMRGWKEATAAVEQAERVLFLLCRRHRAIRAAAELHTLTASLKASPAAAVGAAGEDATPCLAPHVCPYAWTALQAGTDRFAALMTERARAHSVPLPAQFAGGGESGPFLAYQALTAAGTDLQHCVEGLVEDLLLRIAAARSDADAALLAVTTAPTSDALSGQAVRAAEDVLEEAMSGLDRVATPVDAKSGQVMLLRRELDIVVRGALRGYQEEVFEAHSQQQEAGRVQVENQLQQAARMQTEIRELRSRCHALGSLLRQPVSIPKVRDLSDPLAVLRLLEEEQSARRTMRVKMEDAFERGRLQAIVELQSTVLDAQAKAAEASEALTRAQAGVKDEVQAHMKRVRNLRQQSQAAKDPLNLAASGPAVERAIMETAVAAAAKAQASATGSAQRGPPPEAVDAAVQTLRQALENREQRAIKAIARVRELEATVQQHIERATDTRVAQATTAVREQQSHSQQLAARDAEVADLRNKWQQAEAEHEQNIMLSRELRELRAELRKKTVLLMDAEEERSSLQRELSHLRKDVVEVHNQPDLQAQRAAALRDSMRALYATYVAPEKEAPSPGSPTPREPAQLPSSKAYDPVAGAVGWRHRRAASEQRPARERSTRSPAALSHAPTPPRSGARLRLARPSPRTMSPAQQPGTR